MSSLSETLIDLEIVKGRHDVCWMAKQANGCFENCWYDACAVMLRRLVEVLIVESFCAKGRLDDIRGSRGKEPFAEYSDPLNAAEVKRFVSADFARLEEALQNVWVSLGTGSRHSPLVRHAASANWRSIAKRHPDKLEAWTCTFHHICSVKQAAQENRESVAAEDLTGAAKLIDRILKHLNEQFPRAGVSVPSGDILPLGELIPKYVGAGKVSYWRVERGTKPAMSRIKELGGLGAHGYRKVTGQNLLSSQDALNRAIQQLVRTAYPR